MASPFQRYTSGIEASTGNLVQASGRMAEQTLNVFSNIGNDIAEGIKSYNKNAEKSEAVNAKIQMLGQEYADKIAMYAKDPEIAQSGILDGMMSTAKMLQEAPTKGYNQRAIIAQEAEGKLQGFGGKLQEWSFLRGREMERAAEEGLNKFAGVTSVTSPAFAASKEFQFDPNKSFVENKAEAIRKLNAIRAKNPKMQGTDNEFIQNWLQNTEQTMAKVDSSVVPAAVTNDILSQIQTERKIIKGYEEMPKTGLAVNKNLTFGDLETLSTAAIESLRTKPTATAQGTGTAPAGITPEETSKTKEEINNLLRAYLFARPEERDGIQSKIDALNAKIAPAGSASSTKVNKVSPEEVKKTKEEIKALEGEIRDKFGVLGVTTSPARAKQKEELQGKINALKAKITPTARPLDDASAAEQMTQNNKIRTKVQTYADQSEVAYLQELQQKLNSGDSISFSDRMKQHYAGNVKRLNEETRRSIYRDPESEGIPKKVIEQELGSVDKRRQGLDDFVEKLRRTQDLGLTETGKDILPEKRRAMVDMIQGRINELSKPRQKPAPVTVQQFREAAGKISGVMPTSATQEQKIAPIALGEQVVGSQEVQQRRSIAERQREVADFVTSKMGAIDPTDPERKRRLPVSGFDKFYRSLVPEAEIREYTTPSGVRMMYANGKWEQIKGAEPMSIKDIREANLGVFGTQTERGLVPSEYIDGSGVFIGGIYKGSNPQLEKFEDEMTKLIDARRGIKKLSEINDRVGEVFSPEAQGQAQVEVMNLSAALRTDIVGVGTVSNYEQELIAKVIDTPTRFFNLESKERAILLALAQRVDRRMKAIASSKGLTIQIKDGTDGNKYQALREQYLREKGILK